ncbi:MAG: alpha/beta fold hydrolase [Usitatibacter sp.]
MPPPAPWPTSPAPIRSRRWRSTLSSRRPRAASTWQDTRWAGMSPELTGTIGGMALAVGKEGFARQQQANIGRVDSRPFLKDIACPTLVIAARQDAIMPLEWLRELAEGIPGARLEIIEECGHMAPLEKPAAVAALLRHWLGN